MSAKSEIRDYAIDRLNDGVGEGQYGSDLHHELFNTDYYIIGRYEARKFLEDKVDGGVFGAIDEVQRYEDEQFGERYTDVSDPEKLVNMYAYVIGQYLLWDSPHLQRKSDKKLTIKDLEIIQDQI